MSAGQGGVDPAVAADDASDPVDGDLVERGQVDVFDRDGLACGGGAGHRFGGSGCDRGWGQQVAQLLATGQGHGADHRQRVDALDQVVPGRLAELFVGGDDIEDVVDNLEGHAVMLPEVGDGVDGRLVELAHDAADPTGRREQRCRLARDGSPVGVLGAARIEHRLQLTHLALTQLGDGGGQQSGHVGAERRGDLRCPGQQEVAGQDGPQVPPPGVDRDDRSAGDRLIHDVVVVERSDVHQLDRYSAQHGGF